MVPVKVGDGDVIDAHHAHPGVPQGNLRPFPAIEEELFLV